MRRVCVCAVDGRRRGLVARGSGTVSELLVSIVVNSISSRMALRSRLPLSSRRRRVSLITAR